MSFFIFLISFVLPMSAVALYGLYMLNDSFFLLARRYIFKEKIVEIEVIGTYYSRGDYWKSNVKVRPSGAVVAFKYPAGEIGPVILNEDGTGRYHTDGDIIWKYI